MEELEEAGWKATENKSDEEIKDIDMKEMFDAADQERRDSQDLVAVPRKVIRFTPHQYKSNIFIQVYSTFNRNTVAKVTGVVKFAKKQSGFMNIDLDQLRKVAK